MASFVLTISVEEDAANQIAELARRLRMKNGENISRSEAVRIAVREMLKSMDNEEPAGETAGAASGENVAG